MPVLTRSATWRAPFQRPNSRQLIGAAAAAIAISLIYPLTAFKYGPFALPGALIAVVVVTATVSRPEIGVATALAMFPLANFGLLELGVISWPSWLPIALWVAFVFALAVAHHWRDQRNFPRLGVLLIVYLAVTIVSFGIAASQTDALPILRSVTVGLLLFFATALSVRDRNSALWVVAGIAVSGFLEGAVATYQHFTGTNEYGFVTTSGAIVSRAVAGLHTPNELGGFLVILVPFILAGFLIARRSRRLYGIALLCGVALLFSLLGIYASFSRGAIVALISVPLFFISKRHLLLLLPFFVALVLVATPGVIRERFDSLSSSGEEVATRTDIWRAAIDIWEQHPLFGAGAGSFPTEYAEARIPGKQYLPNRRIQPPPHAHNVFLQELAESGLVGLLALLAILILALRTAWLVRKSPTRWLSLMGTASLASITAFLIHNQVDLTLIEGTGMYFWGLLGLLSALFVIRQRELAGDAAERA
jgi:putative inorganic carbon (HCO3(-)) transporter